MSAFRTPAPRNEPVLNYAPGSPERTALKAVLARMSGETIDIPVVIGGQEFRTGRTINVVAPHEHGRILAKAHLADPALIAKAVDSAVEAQRGWAAMPFADRAAVFLKAADLLAGPWRQVVNAATMLGQSKTAYQAEIDSACELIDFFRLNVHFAERLYEEQPFSSPGIWNRMDHRPLEGFIYAITPFNFTAIGGNLPTTPAILGNVAVWKPAASALLSNWYVFKLLEAAGLPPGVINFVPGSAAQVIRPAPGRPAAGRHPLHRLDRGVPVALAHRRAKPADVRRLSAAGRRDRRQGLRAGPPERRRGRAGGGPGPRRLRVPGTEVQRRLAGLRAGQSLADGTGADGGDDGRHQDGRTSPTSGTSWAPSSTRRGSTRSRSTSRRRRRRRGSSWWRAARPTTRWGTSSSRRCSGWTTRATARCARRSSARCSRCTSIQRRAGPRRSRWWTGPARTH